MLVGRDEELGSLRACWLRAMAGSSQLAVLYGRRRVGKTYLCVHLVAEIRRQGGRGLYFNATEEAEVMQLARFAEALERDLGEEAQRAMTGPLPSWERALDLLVDLGRKRPLLAVLDEVSFLAAATPGFASIVQAVWDRLTSLGPPSGLMLVLTGSAVGTLTRLLDAGGPLFRRAAWQRRLEALPIVDAAKLVSGATPETVVEAYAACGGVPLYLAAWDAEAPAERNLRRLAGTPGGLLLEDAPSVVRDEIGGERGFARVLAAVGTGRTRRGSIASAVEQRIEVPLELLQRSGLVRRSIPLGAPGRATPLYELPDPYLRFWYSVLYRNTELIEGGQGAAVLAREQERWDQHVAWVWEELARAHAVKEVGRRLPAGLVVGRWWDARGRYGIDVLGVEGSRTALVGEARWSRRPLDLRDVTLLLEKARHTQGWINTPLVAVWCRQEISEAVAAAGVLGLGPADVVGTGHAIFSAE